MKKILLIILTLTAISCGKDVLDPTLEFDKESFETNKKLWSEKNISSYTISQELFSLSFGPQPVITTIVKNNILDSVYFSPDYNGNEPLEGMAYFETIDDVFDYIEWSADYYEDQLNSSDNIMSGVKLHVEYDDTYHFPSKLEFSATYYRPTAGGLGIEVIFSDFSVIE